jgi:hypothetical protein
MQHITYMGETIRLKGKLAASRGNPILWTQCEWLSEYQPHISQSNLLPIWKT